jgi:hypothetical protein
LLATMPNMEEPIMKISDEIYEKMPTHLRALFQEVHYEGCPMAEFAKYGERKSGGDMPAGRCVNDPDKLFGKITSTHRVSFKDTGSAARFFYSAKASKKDRMGSKHPTVKPLALMRYLCRLVTPPNGIVLDPFAGSGTTGQAAQEEGFHAIIIEKDREYFQDIERRIYRVEDNDQTTPQPIRPKDG